MLIFLKGLPPWTWCATIVMHSSCTIGTVFCRIISTVGNWTRALGLLMINLSSCSSTSASLAFSFFSFISFGGVFLLRFIFMASGRGKGGAAAISLAACLSFTFSAIFLLNSVVVSTLFDILTRKVKKDCIF